MKIDFSSAILPNGMKVLVHKDTTTPMVAFNLLYDVGSKDEDPNYTGLAHLLEHLMFSGSKNVKDFDKELEEIGGENNAFTNNDFTNYYIHLPKEHLEVAFRIESDRMRNLTLSDAKIKVQKGVVCEEYKERYLNRPYGDADLLLRPVCYKKHPYLWSTIGKNIEVIEQMPIKEIRRFYESYYMPNNAILSVAGPVEAEEIFEMSNKWFGSIEPKPRPVRLWIPEPIQSKARKIEVERDVPSSAIYKVYHMSERMSPDFYGFDLISDLFSNGKSSRFYVELVKKQRLFNDINAYVSADIEPGTFVISGHLKNGVSYEKAEAAIKEQIQILSETEPELHELEKIKNKLESSLLFSNLKAIDKATNLCYFELMGQAENLSDEMEKYEKTDGKSMQKLVKQYLKEENSSTLYYKGKNV